MKLRLARYTALGRRRNNEDAAAALQRDDGLLAVVADGLGGYSFGERASQEAVNTLQTALEGRTPSAERLEAAIDRADQAVRALQGTYPGAMTTVAAVWSDGARTVAGHVGDTRIYQVRDGVIVYQSEDHSLAQLAVKNGEIAPEEIRAYPERNVLFRALGGRGKAQPEIRQLSLRPGDRLLLCSDGFWEPLTEEQMLRLAAGTDTAESWLAAMREIVEPAADDNNTAIAAQILTVTAEEGDA